MNIIYIVVGFDDIENKILYAGSNRIRAARTFNELNDSFQYADVWIEIWENEVQLDDEWRPYRE